MPRPGATVETNNTFVLEKNKKAVTMINITDPDVTAFVTVEPNANVSLVLMLAHGSPPNETQYSNKTILTQEGNCHYKHVFT